VKVFYTDSFVLPLPAGHRFPMQKYALLRERLVNDGAVAVADLEVPPAALDYELERAHDRAYVEAVRSGALDAAAMRRIGFPWSPAMVERSRRSVGATISGARAALRDGFAASLAGGTHHAFRDRGEGYCVFNDIAVAIKNLQPERALTRSVVIDLDVHQGNGTAAFFATDDSVFTLSVHGANNFPFHKETSDLDLPLPDRTTDDRFLAAVAHGLAVATQRPADLAFYIAGADPFEGDRLGRLAVSKRALAERDCMVFDACARTGLPVVIVMGGGYAHDVHDTVEIHAHSVSEAARRAGNSTSVNR
jgi:acetoin utilization deacetylase AcuC-like enzyme